MDVHIYKITPDSPTGFTWAAYVMPTGTKETKNLFFSITFFLSSSYSPVVGLRVHGNTYGSK